MKQQHRSVASSQKLFMQKRNEEGGGVAKSVQKQCENKLVPNQPQNWHQKLQLYRAEQSEHKPA